MGDSQGKKWRHVAVDFFFLVDDAKQAEAVAASALERARRTAPTGSPMTIYQAHEAEPASDEQNEFITKILSAAETNIRDQRKGKPTIQ
jgi:hypothetical protein